MSEDAGYQNRDQQLEAMIRDGQLAEAITLLSEWHEREPWDGDVLMRLAVVHWLAGEPARTLRDLDALLELMPDNAEALARRAQALLVLGKHEDAEASLARAEAIDPKTPGVLLNRALVLEDHGDLEPAIEAMSAYLALVPTDHLAVARRSHLYRRIGQFDLALQDAQVCVQMHPEDPESHFAEALARITLEQGEEALAACDRCLKLKEDFLPALRLQVDLLADFGRLEQARASLIHLQNLDPGAPHTAMLQARMASEFGDFSAALDWIARYLDDFPDEPYGYYRRGMIFYKKGDFERALADFEEYARLAPNALEAFEQQFLCLLELGRYQDAATAGAKAMALYPNNFRLQYNLGFAELLSGQTEPALEHFHAALDLDPANEDILLRIHMTLSERTTPEERLAWFQTAAGRHGAQSPMLIGLLAEVYLDTGHPQEALQLTQQVLEIDPNRPFGYLLGIKALCLLNRYPEALTLADAGIQMLPQDGRLRIARAVVYRDSGETDRALQDLEEAKKMLPGDAEVLRQQALTLGSVGKVTAAVHLLEEAILQDPDNTESYFWLGYFQLHRQQYTRALEAAEHMLSMVPNATPGRLVRGIALRALGQNAVAEEELARVQYDNPVLYAHLSADPVIAAILAQKSQQRLGTKMRRTFENGWQALRHALGYEV